MHQRTWQVMHPSDEQLTTWRSWIGRPLDIRWNGDDIACVLAELHADQGTARLVVELENDQGLPAGDVPLTVDGDTFEAHFFFH